MRPWRAEDAGIRTGALETEYREYRTLEEELARLLEESRILTIQWKEQQELARRHVEATAWAGERRSRGKWLLEEAEKERKRLEEEKEVCSCSIEEVALEVSTARDIAEKEAEAHRRAEDAAAGGSAIRYAGRRGAELLEERSRARALAGKRTELLTRREALRSEQSRMERLAQRERILGETSVQLQARLAYMKQGAAQMASGTCPVAGVPCPLGEGMDPSFLEARTAELTEELAALQEERMDVSQALAESNLTEAFLALERDLPQCAQGEAQAMELTEAMEELRELVPLTIVKMFSSSAATGLVLDIFKQYGTDSRIGLIASISMCCTETIFYTMSVYFMAANVKKTRYTLAGALIATGAGLIASVVLAGWMNG